MVRPRAYGRGRCLRPQLKRPHGPPEPSVLQIVSGSRHGECRRARNVDISTVPTQAWKVARARMRLNGLAPGWSAGVGVRETVASRERPRSADQPPAGSAGEGGHRRRRERAGSRSHPPSAERPKTSSIGCSRRTAESAVVMVARTAGPPPARSRPRRRTRARFRCRSRATTWRPTCHFAAALRRFTSAPTDSRSIAFTCCRAGFEYWRANRMHVRCSIGQPRSRHQLLPAQSRRRRRRCKDRCHELRSDVTLSRLLPFDVVGGESDTDTRVQSSSRWK